MSPYLVSSPASVLARAVHVLLPALEDDEDDEEKNNRPPPFVTVPLSATEDAVVGTIDVEASARLGEPVYEPGLLARADRGVLYLDELNLADETVVDCALHAVSARRCVVERTGVSASWPCRGWPRLRQERRWAEQIDEGRACHETRLP